MISKQRLVAAAIGVGLGLGLAGMASSAGTAFGDRSDLEALAGVYRSSSPEK